jgi:hypothetical protein
VARLCFELDPDTIAVLHISYVRAIVIAGEPEGSRRDCNTMEKQRGRR